MPCRPWRAAGRCCAASCTIPTPPQKPRRPRPTTQAGSWPCLASMRWRSSSGYSMATPYSEYMTSMSGGVTSSAAAHKAGMAQGCAPSCSLNSCIRPSIVGAVEQPAVGQQSAVGQARGLQMRAADHGDCCPASAGRRRGHFWAGLPLTRLPAKAAQEGGDILVHPELDGSGGCLHARAATHLVCRARRGAGRARPERGAGCHRGPSSGIWLCSLCRAAARIARAGPGLGPLHASQHRLHPGPSHQRRRC